MIGEISHMAQVLLWKQIFSDYHNLDLSLSRKQVTRYLSNVSGNKIRVKITNKYGRTPLILTNLSLSTTKQFHDSYAFSLHGEQLFSIPAGETRWTDWLSFDTLANHPIYFSIEAKNKQNSIFTLANTLDNQIIEVLQPLNDDYPTFYYGIESIEVDTSQSPKLLAFFGDSLTSQGYFTGELTQRLYQAFPNKLTTMNAGISGNRLLREGNSISEWSSSFGEAGIVRFKKDVLSSSPDIVLFLAGINDLFHPGAGTPSQELPSTNELISGIKFVQELCEESGCLFCPVTLSPFKGSSNHGIASWSPEKEKIREDINHYILTLPHAIHLAEFTCDEVDSALLKECLDSGDHLHFSSLGGKTIGAYLFTFLTKTIFQ